MSVSVGVILEGVVTGITNFGAFVELPGGVTGLVHISEVANTYVKDINDYLEKNDKIKVKVIHVDPKGKIGLSIKQAQAQTESNKPVNTHRERSRGSRGSRGKEKRESFEEKLANFLKVSDEIQSEFRKNTDAKRGGRGSSHY